VTPLLPNNDPPVSLERGDDVLVVKGGNLAQMASSWTSRPSLPTRSSSTGSR
jgi:hypothetical protein